MRANDAAFLKLTLCEVDRLIAARTVHNVDFVPVVIVVFISKIIKICRQDTTDPEVIVFIFLIVVVIVVQIKIIIIEIVVIIAVEIGFDFTEILVEQIAKLCQLINLGLQIVNKILK